MKYGEIVEQIQDYYSYLEQLEWDWRVDLKDEKAWVREELRQWKRRQ